MMRLAGPTLLLLSLPLAVAAQVPGTGHSWQVVPEVTSADLAEQGWSVVESAGLTTPDGTPVVVTFWQLQRYGRSVIMRCAATLDADLNPVADVCSEPAHSGEQ